MKLFIKSFDDVISVIWVPKLYGVIGYKCFHQKEIGNLLKLEGPSIVFLVSVRLITPVVGFVSMKPDVKSTFKHYILFVNKTDSNVWNSSIFFEIYCCETYYCWGTYWKLLNSVLVTIQLIFWNNATHGFWVKYGIDILVGTARVPAFTIGSREWELPSSRVITIWIPNDI